METPVMSRELVYSESFKDMIRSHPGILGSFKSLVDTITAERLSGGLKYGDEFEDGDLRLKIIGSAGDTPDSEGQQVGRCRYFKAQVGAEAFFIKCIPGLSGTMGLGAEEFRSLEEASRLLKGMEGVGVIDFQLGYQDQDVTYFVSKWSDAVRFVDHLGALNSRGDDASMEEKKNLLSRFKAVNSLMEAHDFLDFDYNNVLYDSSTDTLVVFDVHKNAA